MNWDAVGAIGEILGALAVFLTLLYLAAQIRQNSHLAKTQLNVQGIESFSRYRQMVVANADVVAKLRSGETLTGAEEVIAETMASEMMFNYASLIRTAAVHDPERIDALLQGAAVAAISNRQYWSGIKSTLARNGFGDIVARIDGHPADRGTRDLS